MKKFSFFDEQHFVRPWKSFFYAMKSFFLPDEKILFSTQKTNTFSKRWKFLSTQWKGFMELSKFLFLHDKILPRRKVISTHWNIFSTRWNNFFQTMKIIDSSTNLFLHDAIYSLLVRNNFSSCNSIFHLEDKNFIV